MAEILIDNVPFEYEKLPFNYSVDSFDLNDARSFLTILNQVFENNKIHFFLNFGTLLGAYRDNSFIPHDNDLDLGIFEKDKTVFLRMIPEFEKRGVKLCGEWGGILYTFIYKGITCDFNVFYKPLFPYRFYYYGVGEWRFVPIKYLKKLKPFTFLNESFYIPEETEGYLQYLYGENWRIPQKGRGAVAMPKWMILEELFRKIKRKIRWIKAKYITHTEFY
jgi:hypothetical protein